MLVRRMAKQMHFTILAQLASQISAAQSSFDSVEST